MCVLFSMKGNANIAAPFAVASYTNLSGNFSASYNPLNYSFTAAGGQVTIPNTGKYKITISGVGVATGGSFQAFYAGVKLGSTVYEFAKKNNSNKVIEDFSFTRIVDITTANTVVRPVALNNGNTGATSAVYEQFEVVIEKL